MTSSLSILCTLYTKYTPLRRGVPAASEPHELVEDVRLVPTQSFSFHHGLLGRRLQFTRSVWCSPHQSPTHFFHHGHPGLADAVGQRSQSVGLYQAWNHPARASLQLFRRSPTWRTRIQNRLARTPRLHFSEASTLINKRKVNTWNHKKPARS